MDHSEAVKVVMERISKLEPEPIVMKAIGYTYIHGFSDQEMIRLALGPDSLIHTLIQNAKAARIQASAPPVVSLPTSPPMNPSPLQDPSFQFAPFSPVSVGPISPPASFHKVDPYSQIVVDQHPIHNSGLKMVPYSNYICLEDPREAVKSGLSCYPMDYYCHEAAFNNVSIRGGRHFAGLVDYPVKTCHYHNKGYCKHGINCQYYHKELFPDGDPHMFSHNSYDASGEDYLVSPGSLEKLEFEIVELLISRRGCPVSIASLPMIYYDKYGKTLQAEGYLTESQRHGKTGYSLTKLLARLKNIRVIDRPHGQHAVILAEDVPKYLDIRGERNDPGPIVSGSRQIYLTFPAECTFTEEDVSNHFSTYGPVQDVRIPCQQKRMFGFVTFVSTETVRLILAEGNPHFVCGARVLVKPYREKSKLVESRKYAEKIDYPFFHWSEPIDININPELQASWESARLVRRQLMGEYEQAVEQEAMRPSKLQLSFRPATSQSCLGYTMDDLKVQEDNSKFPSAERLNQWLDSVNGGSNSDNKPKTPIRRDNSKFPSAERLNQWLDSVNGGSNSDDKPKIPIRRAALKE